MKVAIVLRADADAKGGGDVSQLKGYAESLMRLDVSVEVLVGARSLQGRAFDIVHAANLDLPLEAAQVARAAKESGARFVLSTISHPLEGMRAMYSGGEDVLYAKLLKLKIPPSVGIASREVIKQVSRGRYSSALHVTGLQRMQQRVLDNVDLALAIAPGEASYLSQAFRIANKPIVLPNAMGFEKAQANRREHHVGGSTVVIGRIEPRKNSLEMARACASARIQVRFAGAINRNHAAYAAAFLALADEIPYCTYLGPLGREDVQKELKRSSHYVNPAWFEVVSLADCEAAATGVPIATTRHSYIDDVLPGVERLDPSLLASDHDGSYIASVISRAKKVKPPVERGWDEVGLELIECYRAL